MPGLELLEAVSDDLTDDQFVAAVLLLGGATEAMEAAEALGPVPVLEDYTGDTPAGDWADDYTEWWLAVWMLPKSIQDAITAEIPEPDLGCGPPGHDYADHIVKYKGKAILDVSLSWRGLNFSTRPPSAQPKGKLLQRESGSGKSPSTMSTTLRRHHSTVSRALSRSVMFRGPPNPPKVRGAPNASTPAIA